MVLHISVLSLLTLLLVDPSECFSAASRSRIDRIKSIIIDNDEYDNVSASTRTRDATTIPLGKISNSGLISQDKVSYASDLAPFQDTSVRAYSEFALSRHTDCIDLFDGYESKLIRCEVLDEGSLNMRWEVSWIPAGSTWLYNLADLAGWNVTKRSPDPAAIATFSWKSVFGTFRKAFSTGNITLPISSVEGSTVVSFSVGEEGSMGEEVDCRIKMKETIDLVSEADKSRLQNRRVAQELASWIDVSRRPHEGIDADEWASIVRQRILTGVTGAGALDVDPNEDDAEAGIALLIFGAVCLGALSLSFEYFIVPEIVGGTGSIPAKCDDATILEFGSGYLSECFGPFGDPLY